MPYIAYSIATAAVACASPVLTLTLAVKDRTLKAYRIDDQAVILKEDLIEWVKTNPTF